MPANLGVYDVLGTIVCETGVGVGVCGVGDDTALSVGDVAGDKLGDNSLECALPIILSTCIFDDGKNPAYCRRKKKRENPVRLAHDSLILFLKIDFANCLVQFAITHKMFEHTQHTHTPKEML